MTRTTSTNSGSTGRVVSSGACRKELPPLAGASGKHHHRHDPHEHPEDDALLSSIRAVREIVVAEFRLGETERRAMVAQLAAMKQRSSSASTKQPETKIPRSVSEEEQKDDGDCVCEDGSLDSDGEAKSQSKVNKQLLQYWKDKCLRLEEKQKQQEQERNEKSGLPAPGVDEEKEVLVSTLLAQQQQAEQLKARLSESRTNAEALGQTVKKVVATMEEEKQSIARERDVAFSLLEESRQQLLQQQLQHAEQQAQQHQKQQEHAKAVLNNSRELESQALRIEKLETVNARLAAENDELEATAIRSSALEELLLARDEAFRGIASKHNTNDHGIIEIQTTTTSLQQKLKALETSLLEKDARTIRSLELQIQALEKQQKEHPSSDSATSTPASSLEQRLASKKKQLRDSRNRLRTNSLDVVGDTILLQLRRLVEIHRHTHATAAAAVVANSGEPACGSGRSRLSPAVASADGPARFHSGDHPRCSNTTGEWESTLRKLSENRERMLALLEEDADGAAARAANGSESDNVPLPAHSRAHCHSRGGKRRSSGGEEAIGSDDRLPTTPPASHGEPSKRAKTSPPQPIQRFGQRNESNRMGK